MLMGLCVFHITNECNLKCKHCYAAAGPAMPDELTFGEIESIADELQSLSINYVTISGGEPFLRSDVFEIIKLLRQKKFHLMVTSNGTSLDEATVLRVKEAGVDSIQVSLDSSSEDVHDSFRGVRGAYAEALRGIKLCTEHGVKVSIMSTLSSVNRDRVDDLIQLGLSLGVNGFAIERFVPEGRGDQVRDIAIAPNDLKNCFELLFRYQTMGLPCVFSTNDPLFLFVGDKFKYVHELAKNNPDLCGGCSIGKMAFSITPSGQVALCTRLYKPVGSVRESSLKEILSDSDLLKEVCDRTQLKGRCGRCKYRNLCGGCRGWAYRTTGDYHAEDSLCWLSEEQITSGI